MEMETKQHEAIDSAQRVADSCGLPQTVYCNGESGGWWHRNALSNLLWHAEVSLTVLPIGYFY